MDNEGVSVFFCKLKSGAAAVAVVSPLEAATTCRSQWRHFDGTMWSSCAQPAVILVQTSLADHAPHCGSCFKKSVSDNIFQPLDMNICWQIFARCLHRQRLHLGAEARFLIGKVYAPYFDEVHDWQVCFSVLGETVFIQEHDCAKLGQVQLFVIDHFRARRRARTSVLFVAAHLPLYVKDLRVMIGKLLWRKHQVAWAK